MKAYISFIIMLRLGHGKYILAMQNKPIDQCVSDSMSQLYMAACTGHMTCHEEDHKNQCS